MDGRPVETDVKKARMSNNPRGPRLVKHDIVLSVTSETRQKRDSRKSMDAMSNRTKQRRSGGLTLLLYQRTLHPELFKILASEQVSRRAYEADIWLVEGGHVISLSAGKNTLTEVIVTNHEPLTDRGLLQTIPCRGEKNHEMMSGGT